MSLIAWYPLNGDILDHSGNENHLTNSNTAEITISDSGKIGRCYNFTGIGYLSSANDVTLHALTYAAWIKRAENVAYLQGIVCNFDHRGSNGYNVSFSVRSNGALSIDIAIKNGTSHFGYYGSQIIPIGVWTHVAVSVNTQSGDVCFYINGEIDKEIKITNTNHIPIIVAPEKLMVGQWGWSYQTAYKYIGDLNDVRVYDHILSNKEIKEISKAKILHYTFDEPVQPHTNIIKDAIYYAYNNAGSTNCPSSLVDTGRYYQGCKVYRLTQTPNDTAIASYGFRTSLSNHGVYTNSVSCTALKKYCASILWKPISHADTVFGGNAQNSPSYWKVGTNQGVGDGWTKYHQYMDGVTNTTTKSNPIFFSYYVPSLISGESIVIDFCCPSLVEGTTVPVDVDYNNIDEDIVNDISGYSNNGTISKATTPVWTKNSKIGTGVYEFDGIDDYIRTPTLSALGLNSFTINMWAYVNESGTRDIFIGNYNDIPHFNIEKNVNNAVRVYWNGIFDFASPNNTIPINQWFMLTVIRDKHSSEIRIYINGSLIHTRSVTLPDLSLTTGLYVGRDTRTGATALNGNIDDLRIYATVLSVADINELYQTRASLDNSGNFIVSQIVENIEPTTNLLPYTDYSDRTYGYKYVASSWGGDVAEAYYYKDGGYNNLPYTKMIKTSAGDGGSYMDDHIDFELVAGKTYTVSCYMKASHDVTLTAHAFSINRISDNDYTTTIAPSLTTTWKRFHFTFTSTKAGQFRIRKIVYIDQDLPLTVYWCGMQLEEKDHPTPITLNHRHQSNSLIADFSYGANSVMQQGMINYNEVSEVGVIEGITAWYPFDGNSRDYSGNKHHGSVSGALLSNGVKGQCYIFDGIDDYITAPSINNSYFSADFSANFWINPKTAGTYGRVFDKTNNTTGCANGLFFYMNGNKGVFGINGAEYSMPVSSVPYNTWTHIVVVVSSGSHIKIYANGELKLTVTIGLLASITNIYPFTIGNRSNATDRTFDGKIDEFRIYNRALLEEEINILYDIANPTGTKMKMTKDKIYITGQIKEV